MIEHAFELGINGNVPKQEALQMGFVTYRDGSPAPSDPNNIAEGDYVTFKLFDLTSPPLIMAVDPTSSSLSFPPVTGEVVASPFDIVPATDSQYVIPLEPESSGSGPSVIFRPGCSFPVWILYANKILTYGAFKMVVTVSINNSSQSFTIGTSFTIQIEM